MNHDKEFCLNILEFLIGLIKNGVEPLNEMRYLALVKCYQFRLKELENMS